MSDPADPYLWLEDVDSERALAWVREQNARTAKELEALQVEYGPRNKARERTFGVMMRGWSLVKCAVSRWAADEASTIGAALAFYCAFSLAPLLIILLTVSGWFIDSEQAYGYVGAQLRSLFGPATAEILLKAAQSSQSTEGVIATVISGFSLLVGATTVFAALEGALERIWDSRALVRGGIVGWLRTRVLSFGMILAVGFLLLVSLTISTALAALKAAIARRFTELVVLASALDFIATTALVTGLIALIYRYMPAKRLQWHSVLWGALVTALLFQVGRWAISVYLGRSTQPSAFGAAASFAALLLWLYYSAQIFLLGAEFTACLGGVQRASPATTAPRLRRESGAPAKS